MSSHREIAKLAGVSVATVSRALFKPDKVSPETIKKVTDAIAQTGGYRPNMLAKSLRYARANAVVLLVPELANTFYASFIIGVGDKAHEHGYAMLIGDTRGKPEQEQAYIERVHSRLADGVIQLRPYSKKEKSTYVEGIPWVNACGCESNNGPMVRIDNRGAAKTMVDYLISLGHRRIGVISGISDNPHAIIRLEGYKDSLAAAGIAFDEALVAQGDFTMWSGQNAARQLCKLADRPTAIFCMNDEMAIGAMQTLKANGLRIPEDVSITGFDNIRYSRFSDPSLTTMSQPGERMGQVAMEMLIAQIEKQPLQETECVLPYEFVVRNSVAAPARVTI